MKNRHIISLLLCILSLLFIQGASQAFAQGSPYVPNLRDYRMMQKIEKRINLIAQQGEKEKIISIIGLSKIGLGKLKDAKSQYILYETSVIAEKQFTTAVQIRETQSSGSASGDNAFQGSGTAIQTGGVISGTELDQDEQLPEGSVTTENQDDTKTTFLESGKASYYASSLEGNNTANGDIFDNKQLTAAHKTLPFNTRVKVINPKNEKRVIVRINDRGPFVAGRVIDLSQEAFKTISPNGTLSAGILDVTLEKVD